MWIQLLTLFSALSFLVYGTTCLFSGYMKREFERYGLARQRTLTGVLQLAGAVGQLAGFAVPLLGWLASGGLGLLMLLGFAVRLRIRDGWLRSSPAFLYMVLNAVLVWGLWPRS